MDEQKTGAERAQEVLNQITQDAWEKTGGDLYGTEPTAESADSQPDAEPTEAKPASSPTTTAAPEPTSDSALPVWGKYRSLEEAERAYHESVRMGNSAKAEADALKARLAAVEQVTKGESTSPEEPDPLAEMESYGMPRKLMQDAIDKRASIKAKEAIQEYFGPALRRAEADQKIIEAHPEYSEKFKEIEGFVEAQPEVRQQVEALNASGNFLAARQIAYLNWKVAESQRVAAAVETVTAAQTAETKASRKDAGVGSTRRSDSRTTAPKDVDTAEDRNRKLELYKAGHQAPYLRSVFDGMLPPDFDNLLPQ